MENYLVAYDFKKCKLEHKLIYNPKYNKGDNKNYGNSKIL